MFLGDGDGEVEGLVRWSHLSVECWVLGIGPTCRWVKGEVLVRKLW